MGRMQGFFKPKNPSKYKGNPRNIQYRSSWEMSYMVKLDKDPKVKFWQSEEVAIPYANPVTGRISRYFPDFLVEMTNGKTYVIEIKPHSQTQQPKRKPMKSKKAEKRFINEAMTYGRNIAKWEAAERFCAMKGYEFKILTEKELKVF